MTTRAKDPIVAMRCPSPVVLFGIENRGKPQGARFRKEHASLALKAATQLQLNVLASNDPKIAEIAARLPVGRVHATGRTFAATPPSRLLAMRAASSNRIFSMLMRYAAISSRTGHPFRGVAPSNLGI